MKQHFIFSALLWIFLLTIEAQAQIKIGYMNPSVVLSQLDEVAFVEQQIEQLVQQRDTELMSKANQLQQDFVAYEEARSMLNEEARIIREEDLLARDQQLQEERELSKRNHPEKGTVTSANYRENGSSNGRSSTRKRP